MTAFDKRQEGFERKFVLDEEQRFRALSRRNRALGLWAAERLGKTGDASAAYAREVMESDFEEAGEEDVFRKIRKDFDAAQVACDDDEIRRMMRDLLEQAAAEIKAAG
jgi:hypothetical protein